MAIVNQLSYSNRKRDQMTNYKNGFSYFANITVLGIAVLLFQFMEADTSGVTVEDEKLKKV